MEINATTYSFQAEKISNAIRNLSESGKESPTMVFQVVDFVIPLVIEHCVRYQDCSHIFALHEAIKEQAPRYADYFTLYLCSFGPFEFYGKSSVVFDTSKRRNFSFPKSFKNWYSKNKSKCESFRDTIDLEGGIFVKIIGSCIKEIPGISCYECGKVFNEYSTEAIDGHICSPRKSPSIKTVSGGAGPGTGKRR